MNNSLERAKEKYSSIPEIDLHFYGMKGFGIKDENIKYGRPKFHFIGSEKLFSLVPLISSRESPYVFENKTLSYKGKDLPFKVKHIGRIGRNPSYFYYRGIKEWIPTLDSETILGINFQPVCKGCEWCCRGIDKRMRNISPEEGLKILKNKRVNFYNIDKMTFVTGMYRNGKEVVKNLLKTVELSKRQGFRGRALYIGSQIREKSQVMELISGLGETPFKYAYTLETFTKREIMHMKKNGSLEDALITLENLRGFGINNLEYSYMPGLDSLDVFNFWMPKFSRLARPHISIFRPAEQDQEKLKDPEFFKDPVSYLCYMRTAFEKEHSEPVYQNNLANLWGFPIDRINPLFLTDKTSLE